MMNLSRKPAWSTAMATALLLLSAGPCLAQRAPVPCSAFSRSTSGGWRVLAPVMLDFGNRLYSPTVGTIFAAGSIQNGVEMSEVLDRHCGNR
jgi:hypothetical protein